MDYQRSKGLIYENNEEDDEQEESSGDEEKMKEKEENENEVPREDANEEVLLRTMRSGQKFGPSGKEMAISEERNKHAVMAMKKLSSSFNPDANRVLHALRKGESKDEGESKSVSEDLEFANVNIVSGYRLENVTQEEDKVEKNIASTAIEHLFRDLAFICRDTFLQKPEKKEKYF